MEGTSTRNNSAALVFKSVAIVGLLTLGNPSGANTKTANIEMTRNTCKVTEYDSRRRIQSERLKTVNGHINSSTASNRRTHSSQSESVIENKSESLQDINKLIADEKILELYNQFCSELKRKTTSRFSDIEGDAYRFLSVAREISTLNYTDQIVQLKDDNAFKFNLFFENEIELMLTFCFNKNDGLNAEDVVYSVFKEDEVISNGVYNFNEFIQGFPKYLSV